MDEAIAEQDAIIIGISADSIDSHRRFRESLSLPFPLLSDTDRHVMALYDVRRRLRFLPNKRVTYVVDKSGKIAGVHHHELTMGRHVQEVLEDLKALGDRQVDPPSAQSAD